MKSKKCSRWGLICVWVVVPILVGVLGYKAGEAYDSSKSKIGEHEHIICSSDRCSHNWGRYDSNFDYMVREHEFYLEDINRTNGNRTWNPLIKCKDCGCFKVKDD